MEIRAVTNFLAHLNFKLINNVYHTFTTSPTVCKNTQAIKLRSNKCVKRRYTVCFGREIHFNKKHPCSNAESSCVAIETSFKRVIGEPNVTAMLLLLSQRKLQIRVK